MVLVGPAELDQELGERAAELPAAAQWAQEHELVLQRRPNIAFVERARRLDGGQLGDRPRPSAVLANCLLSLSEDERAALAQGFVLRLDHVTPAAADVMRSGLPDFLCFDPGYWPETREPTDQDREQESAHRGRPFTDAEWQARLEHVRSRNELRRLFVGLPHEPFLSLGQQGEMHLEDEQGREVLGRPLPPLVGPAATLRFSFVAWDDQTLVPGRPKGDPAVADLPYRWAQIHRPTPSMVQFDHTGVYRLQDLVDRLAGWRPRHVDPALADEALFVTAGETDAESLERAIEGASGLLWRHTEAANDARYLTTHPLAAMEQRAPIAALQTMREELYRVEPPDDVPFAIGEFLSQDGLSRRVAWNDLAEPQQTWFLAQIRFAGVRLDPGKPVNYQPEAAELIGTYARLTSQLVWCVGQAVVLDDDEGTVFYPAGARGFVVALP